MSTVTARPTSSDSDFERSNIGLKENIPDGVDPNSNGHDYCVRKNEGKILWFSADCIMLFNHHLIDRTASSRRSSWIFDFKSEFELSDKDS